MTDPKLVQLAEQIRALTARELGELNRLIRHPGGDGPTGVREPIPRRPSPTLPAADSEDRSVRGRTL